MCSTKLSKGVTAGAPVFRWQVLLVPAICLAMTSAGWTQQKVQEHPAQEGEILFAHRILPLLREKCWSCHGDDASDIRGQFDMRSLEGLLQGGESGEAALIPQKPSLSPMLLAVRRDSEVWSAMPPKENDRLSTEQIEQLANWIRLGAPWPAADRMEHILKSTADPWAAPGGVSVATSGGQSPQWTQRTYDPANLWAYQPLRTQDKSRTLDSFLDEQLQELKLEPGLKADRTTLIRRATFDLIGLPPTPEEVLAFQQDSAEDSVAFSKVVDRLLASPHYGEQWGRHWLDVARYADSSGFANDFERGNTWRYRDYVVRAFNSDKPYDQFIREQIAGDEIVDARNKNTSEKIAESTDDAELLIAVGFLRMGPWELTGMEVAKVARQRFLDDVTDAVGQVFLGHMLQCARCHDHKFDPIPTRDYYSMQAFFAATQFAEREAAFLTDENTQHFEERRFLEQRREFYNGLLSSVDEKRTIAAARLWYQEQTIDPAAFEKALEEVQRRNQKSDSGPAETVRKRTIQGEAATVMAVRKLLQEQKVPPDQIFPRHIGFAPADFGSERVGYKGIERLKWRLDRYEPYAFSVYTGSTPNVSSVMSPQRMPASRASAPAIEQTCVLVGGDPFSPGEPVQPAVLSVVEKLGAPAPTEATGNSNDQSMGLRLQLAHWIASPDNPLTSRVMVNRVWQWHFGRGLAGNPNNFGSTGQKPTHPELLDWLAGQFIDSGWSVKALHRTIMLSDAYRRSTVHPHPEALQHLDPLGTSYSVFHPRRLDAEELRDAILHVSGELNPEIGGIPARPEINQEAALQPRMVMGSFAEAWQPAVLPSQRHRRSLYALKIRGQRDPFQEVFNAPPPELSCEKRDASLVTPQVFALFNSTASYDRALAWSNRLLNSTDARQDEAARRTILEQAFQEAFGRLAVESELAHCLAHWAHMEGRHQQLHFEPPSYPREVVRNAVEENTGEKFSFTEPLEVFTEFVSDLKPADVGPQIRGLAEVLLVLLNSNEFVYVY